MAEAVIAAAERPLLIVNPEAALRPTSRMSALRRLLVPLDGARLTAVALQPIAALAGRLGASIELLYVAGSGQKALNEPGSIRVARYVDQPQHEWPQWANEVVDRLCRVCAACPDAVPVRVFLARGEVAPEVVRFATEHKEDAIVLVRRSRLERQRAMVLRQILADTSCPVLLVGEQPAGHHR
ncbi:MAG: universal stress protein, partial [Dehalococcoidia bacterium]